MSADYADPSGLESMQDYSADEAYEDAAALREPSRRPWQPVDLTNVLNGTYTPPKPTVGRRSDGVGLFYPGREHAIVSESEGGKTWFALSATGDEMNAGNHVIYLDFEDDEGGIAGRLLTLGIDREVIAERFHYLRPSNALGTGIHLDDLHRTLGEYSPTLGIIDGVTEAMALHGLDPNRNDDAAAFSQMLAKRITGCGAAALSLDHVTKDREGRGRWAIGAQHKLSGLNGASYVINNRTPFGIGMTGKSTIKIAKDRPGQLRRNALASSGGMFWFGDLVLESHDETFAEVSIEAPVDSGDDFRPTHLMTKICDTLSEHGSLSGKKIETLVKGKATTIREALIFLQVDGFVSEHTPYELLRPYVSEVN